MRLLERPTMVKHGFLFCMHQLPGQLTASCPSCTRGLAETPYIPRKRTYLHALGEWLGLRQEHNQAAKSYRGPHTLIHHTPDTLLHSPTLNLTPDHIPSRHTRPQQPTSSTQCIRFVHPQQLGSIRPSHPAYIPYPATAICNLAHRPRPCFPIISSHDGRDRAGLA